MPSLHMGCSPGPSKLQAFALKERRKTELLNPPKQGWAKTLSGLIDSDPDAPSFPPVLQMRQYESGPLDLTLQAPKFLSIGHLS